MKKETYNHFLYDWLEECIKVSSKISWILFSVSFHALLIFRKNSSKMLWISAVWCSLKVSQSDPSILLSSPKKTSYCLWRKTLELSCLLLWLSRSPHAAHVWSSCWFGCRRLDSWTTCIVQTNRQHELLENLPRQESHLALRICFCFSEYRLLKAHL